MSIKAHYGKHISYLVLEMRTFNVPQFYNGFCCYLKSICSSFDKVIKLFTIYFLHPLTSHFSYKNMGSNLSYVSMVKK
jgi:hypothetical protein